MDAKTYAIFKNVKSGSGSVNSVNGQTGEVVLTASDVGALPDDTPIPEEYDDTGIKNRLSTIESKESEWDAKSNFSGSYNDLTDKPTIPSAVTESTVSDWGFTKNTGTYSKPSDGIPKTDLASEVQTSLGKADTALQSVPSTYALKSDLPTKTSEIVNDSGYLTLGTLPIYNGGVS